MRRIVLLFLATAYCLLPTAATAGWVPLGGTGYYLWADASGNYDGWWYTRSYSSYGGYSFSRYARFGEGYTPAAVTTTYGSREKLLEIIAARQATQARLAEAAADHAAFLETLKSAGLQLPPLEVGAYGGAYGVHAGQQTVYGQVAAPLGDAYKNFDVEARVAALQRLDEQAQSGHVQMSQETRRTLREAIGTYERLKAMETKKDAASESLRGLKDLLGAGAEVRGQKSEVRSQRSEKMPTSDTPTSDLRHSGLAAIMATNCIDCHGQRRAEKGLRLDVPAQFADKYDEIVRRVNSDKPDYVMPPPSSGKRLTAEEKGAFDVGK